MCHVTWNSRIILLPIFVFGNNHQRFYPSGCLLRIAIAVGYNLGLPANLCQWITHMDGYACTHFFLHAWCAPFQVFSSLIRTRYLLKMVFLPYLFGMRVFARITTASVEDFLSYYLSSHIKGVHSSDMYKLVLIPLTSRISETTAVWFFHNLRSLSLIPRRIQAHIPRIARGYRRNRSPVSWSILGSLQIAKSISKIQKCKLTVVQAATYRNWYSTADFVSNKSTRPQEGAHKLVRIRQIRSYTSCYISNWWSF